MPKDFVFVDLSPVKSTDNTPDENESNGLVSPSIIPDNKVFDSQGLNTASYFELSSSNDSFQSQQSDDDSIFSSLENTSILSNTSNFGSENYMQANTLIDTQNGNNAMLGLGIMNVDFSSNAGHWESGNDNLYLTQNFNYEQMMPYHTSFNQFPTMEQSLVDSQFENLKRSNTVPELPTYENLKTQESNCHKRSKSAAEPSKKRSGSTFQFKAYKTPKTKAKKNSTNELNHRRTISEPVSSNSPMKTNGLEEYMGLNSQISVALSGDDSSSDESVSSAGDNALTPNTDVSEAEDCTSDLWKTSTMDSYLLGNCGSNQFIGQNELDFDFNTFVSY